MESNSEMIARSFCFDMHTFGLESTMNSIFSFFLSSNFLIKTLTPSNLTFDVEQSFEYKELCLDAYKSFTKFEGWYDLNRYRSIMYHLGGRTFLKNSMKSDLNFIPLFLVNVDYLLNGFSPVHTD